MDWNKLQGQGQGEVRGDVVAAVLEQDFGASSGGAGFGVLVLMVQNWSYPQGEGAFLGRFLGRVLARSEAVFQNLWCMFQKWGFVFRAVRQRSARVSVVGQSGCCIFRQGRFVPNSGT